MRTNTKLALVALLLLVGSVWAYTDSVSRGERFQSGQKLLPNLNPDAVATVRIEKGEETTTLRRGEDGFTIAEVHAYPAKNEAINRFLQDLLAIELEKEVGRGTSLASDLEIEPPGEETVDIVLSDASDQEMVHLRLGKSFADGPGRYVRRMDRENAPIYLTVQSPGLSTSADAFLDKEIVDVARSEIERIEGGDFVLTSSEDDTLRLAEIPSGKKEKAVETGKIKSILERLTFEDVFLGDDEELRGLVFEERLVVHLDDGTRYNLALASQDDRHFLIITGRHQVERVEIDMDTPEEELREKADLLSRAEEIESFNRFHRSWIYEISDYTANKLLLEKEDLVEDAG